MRNPVDLILLKLSSFGNNFFLQVPNFVAGAVFLAVAWVGGRYAAQATHLVFRREGREDLGALLGSLAKGLIYVVALLIAAAIVFPGVRPGDVLATLGIGSVAIGFAFKDILQNLLAGLLLLVQRPYRRGDQIKVKDYEGTIEHIQSRSTAIKTYDGRRVIIPNSDLYTSPVIVNTAFDSRRDQYEIGIGYGDDLDLACRVFEDALRGCDGVLADPAPEALPWSLDDNWVTIRTRWWTRSLRTEQVHVRARVIRALWGAARANAIDLPFPTQVMLFHDQTDEHDGDRAREREGWPSTPHDPKARRRPPPQHDADRDD